VLLSRRGQEKTRRLTADVEWRKREVSGRQELFSLRDSLAEAQLRAAESEKECRKLREMYRSVKEERDYELAEAYLERNSLRKTVVNLGTLFLFLFLFLLLLLLLLFSNSETHLSHI
jgi:hypothetical protein